MSDQLYRSEYQHITGNGKDCEQCDPNQILECPECRTNRIITVHYGTMASGNTVLKDATIRDAHAKDPESNISFLRWKLQGC
jgi:hypothetical protein